MDRVRTLTALASAGIVLSLISAGAYGLVHSQEAARQGIRDDFADNAVRLQRTVSTIVEMVDPGDAATIFDVPDDEVPAALPIFLDGYPEPRSLVLDAEGRVLAETPPSLQDDPRFLDRNPWLRDALHGTTTISDLYSLPGEERVVDLSFTVHTQHGVRVVVAAFPAEDLAWNLAGFVSSPGGVPDGRAYVVDGHFQVLASSTEAGLDTPLAEPGLVAAVQAGSSGTLGDDYFASSPVTGTHFRVVLIAPSSTLYDSVDGSTRRTSWILYGAFVLSLFALVALGATALRRSARLAYERLHDALTGLPNRALFLDRANRALASSERKKLLLAVLVIDLDRFKAVNDSLGHAAGDDVLKEVARRLCDSVRVTDTVGRFGGDEFMVLCEDLRDEGQALDVANRIQQSLRQPFTLGTTEVTIDSSIGVVLQRADDPPSDGAALIHEGDIAMYRAKNSGRACVEIFNQELNPPTEDLVDAAR